jgi:lysozyme
MKTGSKGIELIKSFEGFKAEAYLCPANVWTIGYGTTSGVKRGQTVTIKEAEDLLQKDLVKFENTVNSAVKVKLTQDQFDALVSFVYNVGPGNFRSSTLLSLLNQGDYASVPFQMARWNRANGRVLAGLTRRRKAEGDLFRTGRFTA